MIHLSNLERGIGYKDHFKNVKSLKSMKMIIFFVAVFALSQCKSATNKFVAGELIEIDVSRTYPEKVLYLQDIAKVEYIPLETNSNTLMSSSAKIVHVSDDYIIASNTGEGDVFVFDGKGKSKFSFNHRGPNGAMEYRSLTDITFDEKAKEIFIYDLFSNKWFVYAEDGNFIRTFAGISSPFLPQGLYNFDDETLLVYDEHGLTSGLVQDIKYSKKPYLFISKKDGSIVDTLNIHLPVRVPTTFFITMEVDGKIKIGGISIPIINNRTYGKNFFIADLASDTIYKLTTQRELQPMIVRKSPVRNTDPKIVISNNIVTDRFIMLNKTVVDYEKAKEMAKIGKGILPKGLMCDFKTGQINEYKLINRDFEMQNIELIHAITPENTGVVLLDVSLLFEEDEAGKINGKLKEFLKSLNEEDNPVLMKIKF